MKKVHLIVMGALGRMGSTILQLAQKDPEFLIAALLEREDKLDSLKFPGCLTGADLREVLPALSEQSVIIDFTQPMASLEHARVAARYGHALVIGTTGIGTEQLQEIEELARQTQIFWAPNMSVGINVLLKLLPELVALLGGKYDLEISEIHHRHKKDAPSGTALKLAQVLAQARDWDDSSLKFCRQGIIGPRTGQEIGVQTLRGGDVVGEHTIYFLGPGERIDITHRAYSRETFAQGALRAAKWIVQQSPGKLYGMADLLD